MKTKLFFLFILIPIVSFCNKDSISNSNNFNFKINLIAGGSYKNFIGPKYVAHTATDQVPGWDYSYPNRDQYLGFTKVPTTCYFAGFDFNYKIFNNFYFGLGGIFCKRHDIYNINRSNFYYSGPNNTSVPRVFNNVKRYERSYKNLELTLKMGYEYKRIGIFVGLQIPMIVYYIEKYIYYIDPQEQSTFFSNEPEKTFTSTEYPLWKSQLPAMFYPCIEVNYLLKIKHFGIQSFAAIEISTDKTKSYYIKGGIIFSYLHYKKTKNNN